MADKLIYITNDDTQNYPFNRFWCVVEAFRHLNQNPIKVSKVVKSTNKKINIKLLGLI